MRNQTNTIQGYYGSGRTACTIYTLDGWYCIDGSVNVNRCDPDLLVDGVDVETLPDYDCFTWSSPIESEEELDGAVNDDEEPEEEEEPSGLESVVNNYINGNLKDAREEAKGFELSAVREAFQYYAGYSELKAFYCAYYLEAGLGYQSACDAE